MFKKIFICSLFIMFFSVVSPVYAEIADTTDHASHHEQNSLDWPGMYHGFLPCDDCNGVKTTLGLNKNNTYILITQYIGKSEREIVEKGKFMAGSAANTLELTPRNSSITRYYFVDKDILIQLDDKGNRIAGKLADRYVLRRTDLKESTPSHAH
ncbi:MAG: hypothetical protein RLZ75_2450 [Pseudomonadota bacterium]|jgi:uncharacterized lipoprotein NlpE involved in copper resistance